MTFSVVFVKITTSMKKVFGALKAGLWFVMVAAIVLILIFAAIIFTIGRLINIRISIPEFEFPRLNFK